MSHPILLEWIKDLLDMSLTNKSFDNDRLGFVRGFGHSEIVLSALEMAIHTHENRELIVHIMNCIYQIDPKLYSSSTLSCRKAIEEIVKSFFALDNTLRLRSQALSCVAMLFDGAAEEMNDSIIELLSEMVARQFPMSSRDFIKGSPEFSDYAVAVEKLLALLPISESPALLRLLIGIFCREPDHVFAENFRLVLSKLAPDLSSTNLSKFMDLCFSMLDDPAFKMELRANVASMVIQPLLPKVDRPGLITFFASKLGMIINILNTPIAFKVTSTEKEMTEQLVKRMTYFNVLKVMYIRLPLSDINSSESAILASVRMDGKELTKVLTALTHNCAKTRDSVLRRDAYSTNIMKSGFDSEAWKSHYYRYTAAAYDCLAAVVMSTQSQEKIYTVFLFKDNEARQQYLWENIVDTRRQYNFEAEFSQPLARIGLNDAVFNPDGVRPTTIKRRRATPRMNYLSSQYLADSSLSQSFGIFPSQQSSTPVAFSALSETSSQGFASASDDTLEMDEINRSPAMPIMLLLIDHLSSNITPLPVGNDGDAPMPAWMMEMHRKFTAEDSHMNIRLFIGKVVVNRQAVFRPFARHWAHPIMLMIVSGDQYGTGLNYYVQDLCLLLLGWAETVTVLGTTSNDRIAITQVLLFLFSHAHHESRPILRNNLNIIKAFIETWREMCTTPSVSTTAARKLISGKQTIHGLLRVLNGKENLTGIQLLGLVLANDLRPYSQPAQVTEPEYYNALLENLLAKEKPVYEGAAEVNIPVAVLIGIQVCGMLLSWMKGTSQVNTEFVKNLSIKVNGMFSAQANGNGTDRYIFCLHKIHLNEPEFLDSHMKHILYLIPKLHGIFKVLSLEMIATRAQSIPQMHNEVQGINLISLLKHREEATQQAALKVVAAMLPALDAKVVQVYLSTLVESFTAHPNLTCRVIHITKCFITCADRISTLMF